MSKTAAKINCLEVAKGQEALALSKVARISFEKLSMEIYTLLKGMDPIQTTEFIERRYGPPSFTVESRYEGLVKSWVLTSPDRQKIIYFESWAKARAARFYFFTNGDHNINTYLIKWLDKISKRSPHLMVIDGVKG